jgi:anti-sigma factor RsiW
MPKCSLIDPLVTPYVDDELTDVDRHVVDDHLAVCAPCRSRVEAERIVRGVLEERRDAIRESDRPPAALRTRCAQLRTPLSAASRSGDGVARAASSPRSASSPWRARLAPLSLAATLVLIVGAAFLYQITASSTTVMAAELAADHVKCFALNAVLRTHQTPDVVESSMASGFDWRMQLPQVDRAGLELVGARPCLYGEGKIAHLMFTDRGIPVSLFMLPKTNRSDELVNVFGHEAAVWSVGDRTFVLIARETEAQVEHLAKFVQQSLR